MKTLALRDEAYGNKDLGYLECYERPRAFYFELPPDADPWELPFILHEFAQRGHLSVDGQWSRRWVESRLVPPERQNLGEVLRVNCLREYDELKLLELTGGRCSQDSCYLVPVLGDGLPTWYAERISRRLLDAFAVGGNRLVLSFADGGVYDCPMARVLADDRAFARVLLEEERFMRVALQPGGHGVQWGERLGVDADTLRSEGVRLDLSPLDLALLTDQVVCDTSEAMRILGCSRQNISDLVRRGKLTPRKVTSHLTLFLRSDVLARRG